MACGIVLILTGTYLAWEVFFFNGRLPSGVRYDFPSKLVYPVLFGAAWFLILRLVEGYPIIPVVRRITNIGVACLLILVSVLATGSVFPIRAAVIHSNVRSNALMDDLRKSRELTEQHLSWPIIVSPGYPFNYESVYTLPVWFKNADISNPIAVLVNIDPDRIKSAFEQGLVQQMKNWSAAGVSGLRPNVGRFVPLNSSHVAEARANGQCFEVIFNERQTNCVLLPYFPPRYWPIE